MSILAAIFVFLPIFSLIVLDFLQIFESVDVNFSGHVCNTVYNS